MFFWPRRSWGRSIRYVLHRMWRLRATPRAIALGCAAGVFVSFTPFLGLHFISAGLLAWMTRGSILASALGTFIGNPVTFPVIWFSAYHLGSLVLGLEPMNQPIDLSAGVFHTSVDTLWPLLKPMTVGGVPLGLMAGAISYYLVKRGAEAYQEKKRVRQLPTSHHPAQA
ncbi:MAG: DUF2062 domain-containing protein [Methyloligellaceae bacterium]